MRQDYDSGSFKKSMSCGEKRWLNCSRQRDKRKNKITHITCEPKTLSWLGKNSL